MKGCRRAGIYYIAAEGRLVCVGRNYEKAYFSLKWPSADVTALGFMHLLLLNVWK